MFDNTPGVRPVTNPREFFEGLKCGNISLLDVRSRERIFEF